LRRRRRRRRRERKEREERRAETAGLEAFIDMNEPAPAELEGHADATWGDRNVYGLILTYEGAAGLHQTKKISLVVECSMHTEAIASGEAAEVIYYAREIERAFGKPLAGPTLLGTTTRRLGCRRPDALQALLAPISHPQAAGRRRRGGPAPRLRHADARRLPHEVDSEGQARVEPPLCHRLAPRARPAVLGRRAQAPPIR